MNARLRMRRHLLRLRRRHGSPRAVCGPLVGCPETGVTLFFPRFQPRGGIAPAPHTLPVLAVKDWGWPVKYQAKAGDWTWSIPAPHDYWPHPDPGRLVRVVQTCEACPSQWDAWTIGGQQLYLRYRFGKGTVEIGDGMRLGAPVIARWDEHDPLNGEISLHDFLSMARLTLDPGAVITRGAPTIHVLTIGG